MSVSTMDVNQAFRNKEIIDCLINGQNVVKNEYGTFDLTEQVKRDVKYFGPEATSYFIKLNSDVWVYNGTLNGTPGYYGNHKDEIWWTVEQHKNIDGYIPLNVESLEQVKKGDCFLLGDTLYKITTRPNLHGDFRTTSKDGIDEWGGWDAIIGYANVTNKLYRKAK